jgi:adenylate cyclase
MIAAMTALSMALATVMGTLIWKGEFASTPPATGIAVLPFESLSADKDNTFFANGVYDGVSSKLAKLANLKLISHESVARFRGVHNTQKIGRALNVPYVLEGSVRREPGRIYLNAKLIDTRSDTQIWATEYNRDLTDLVAIQSEIAQKVADKFAAKVSSTGKDRSLLPSLF